MRSIYALYIIIFRSVYYIVENNVVASKTKIKENVIVRFGLPIEQHVYYYNKIFNLQFYATTIKNNIRYYISPLREHFVS